MLCLFFLSDAPTKGCMECVSRSFSQLTISHTSCQSTWLFDSRWMAGLSAAAWAYASACNSFSSVVFSTYSSVWTLALFILSLDVKTEHYFVLLYWKGEIWEIHPWLYFMLNLNMIVSFKKRNVNDKDMAQQCLLLLNHGQRAVKCPCVYYHQIKCSWRLSSRER